MSSNMRTLKERLIEKVGSHRDVAGMVRSPSWFEPFHSTDNPAHVDVSGHPSGYSGIKGGSAGPGSEAGRYTVPLPGRAIAYRPKKSRVMRWLVLHSDGQKETMQLDKRALIQFYHLDVPTRDMRLMDATHKAAGGTTGMAGGAAGSDPAGNNQLLVRDNALLVCMEHVRCIITADLVIVPLDDDRSDVSDRLNVYLEHVIHERLSDHSLYQTRSVGTTHGGSQPISSLSAALQAVAPEHHHGSQQGPGSCLHPHPTGSSSWAGNLSHATHTQPLPNGPPPSSGGLHQLHVGPPAGSSPGEAGGGNMDPWDVEMPATPNRTGPPSQRGSEELPFELHMLEAALGEVTNQLAREVEGLQATAAPALEDLVNRSDKATLERVRRVKTTHQRLIGRVRAVRESLHRLMEDDADMWRMCLSKAVARKAALQNHNTPAAHRISSLNHINSMVQQAPVTQAQAIPAPQPSTTLSDSDFGSASLRTPSMLALKLHKLQHRQLSAAAPEAILGAPGGEVVVTTAGGLDEDDLHDVLDVEALLEAYFLASDNTLAQLINMGEYIDDTEDLVNIQLDYARNKLIRFEVVLTTGTFALAFMSCVAGILGENLVLPPAITGSLIGFFATNLGVALVCVAIFYAILSRLRARKLI